MQGYKDILIISGLDYVGILEQAFSHMLPEPPKGMYAKGQIEAYILEGKPYYTSSTIVTGAPIDVMSCEEDLYNEQGKLVVPSFMMKNKRKIFTSIPAYRPVAFSIIREFINSHFELVCPYYNNSKFHTNNLDNFFTQNDPVYRTQDMLSFFLDGLTMRLSAFMKNDSWAEYTVESKGYDFIVYKGEDHRIVDWMLKHHKP